jgi:hypothetical protein
MLYRAMALVAASVLMLSGSALAQKKEPTTDSLNLNSSRSNVNRMGAGGGGHARMGGGGGSRTMGAERSGGGGPQPSVFTPGGPQPTNNK